MTGEAEDLFLSLSPGHQCCDLCKPPMHLSCFHIIQNADDMEWNFRFARSMALRQRLVLGEPVEGPRPGGCSGAWSHTLPWLRHFIVPVWPETVVVDSTVR